MKNGIEHAAELHDSRYEANGKKPLLAWIAELCAGVGLMMLFFTVLWLFCVATPYQSSAINDLEADCERVEP